MKWLALPKCTNVPNTIQANGSSRKKKVLFLDWYFTVLEEQVISA